MKIAIETEPKEIADLIVALQGQQDSKSSFVPGGFIIQKLNY